REQSPRTPVPQPGMDRSPSRQDRCRAGSHEPLAGRPASLLHRCELQSGGRGGRLRAGLPRSTLRRLGLAAKVPPPAKARRKAAYASVVRQHGATTGLRLVLRNGSGILPLLLQLNATIAL